MLRKVSHILVAALLLAGGALPVLSAREGRRYQGKVRRLRACVAIVPSMGELVANPATPDLRWSGAPADPDALDPVRSPSQNPYLFYVLDQRPDLKPDGWEIYNPAAPPYATRVIEDRWALRTGNMAALPEGTPISKNMAAYWEVPLNPENFERLREMDVIYLPISRRDPNSGGPVPTYFTEEQRRILARLADSGVTIWVDWALPQPTVTNALGGVPVVGGFNVLNGFFANVDFQTLAGSTAVQPTVGHPLLAGRFKVNGVDVYDPTPGSTRGLGAAYGNNLATKASVDRAVNIRPADMQPTANFAAVVPVTTGGGPVAGAAYVAAARYGSGYVVATAGNFGEAIDRMINANAVKASNEDLSLAEMEDLQFAYNLFSWSTEVTAQQKNGRHTGQSPVQVNGLIEQSTYPNLLPTGGAGSPWTSYPTPGIAGSLPSNPASPLVIDGVVISPVRSRQGGGTVSEVVALDANPNADFDGVGYLDDPINAGTNLAGPGGEMADISIGQNYDRVMRLPLANNAVVTGMSVGESPDTGPQQAKAFVFAAANTGLFSMPAPRPGMPAADYWPNGLSAAPNVNVAYTGAPAFANLPGLVTAPGSVASFVFAGGATQRPFFGSLANGKLFAFSVVPSIIGGASAAPMTPAWYYPPEQEANRMGTVSGPVVTAQLQDAATGAVDTIVLASSVSSGDTQGSQGGGGAGDTTGKVEGWVVATRGDVLSFPRGQNAPGGNNPAAGRRFVSARWLDLQPGVGQVPQTADLIWDPTRHYEVRVLDRTRSYVLHRFVPGSAGFQVLRDGTAGQVELPEPSGPLAVFAAPREQGQPYIWDLSRYVLVADYSPLPTPVDVNGATIRPRFSPSTPFERNVNNVVEPTGVAGGVSIGRDNLVYYGTGKGYMVASEWRKGRAHFRWKMRGLEYGAFQGYSTVVDPDNPAHLADYAFAAAPAAGERVVFASRAGRAYLIDAGATIRFRLLPSGSLTQAQAQEVMLEADHGLGLPQNNPFLLSNQQPWGRVPGQFSVDPDTATVTFNNMENFSLHLAAVQSPQQLAALGIDTGGRPAVPIRWRFRTDPIGTTQTAWVPLPVVAVYQSAGTRFSAGPVIAGDRVYLMAENGLLHTLPLDPKKASSDFPRAGTAWAGFDLATYPRASGLWRLQDIAAALPPRYYAPPAIGDEVAAFASPRGLTLYSSPHVVVADNNRVVEASGDSAAVASADTLVKQRMDLSEFPIPSDPTYANTTVNGVARPLVTETKLLNRLAKVLKLSEASSLTAYFYSGMDAGSGASLDQHSEMAEESYLAADTGNNRCVEFNPAGKVIWELSSFQDPFKLLPAGESRALSGPMDVQRWIERDPALSTAAQPVYVVHTLIADTGNTRVLHVVDKIAYRRGFFDASSYVYNAGQVGANGEPIRWYHVLVWSSQTNSQGLKLKYRTAQRVYWPNASGGLIPIPAGSQVPATVPPYLPPDQLHSYVMASVSGQQVSYPGVPASLGAYNKFFNLTAPLDRNELAVAERKPAVRSGGDSLVFLRHRYAVDENGGPVPVPVREARVGIGGDSFRFSQGVVDPNVPVVTHVWDEMTGSGPASGALVHRLNGVHSVQRTIRADVKLTPWLYGAGATPANMNAQYFLVADTDGVWEFLMLPGGAVPPPGPADPSEPQFRLSWAFTNDDYMYVTGAGNGDPARIFSPNPADQDPGGRRLVAVSARRLPNGLVLVSSRNPTFDQVGSTSSQLRAREAGADVFLLRPADYLTATERAIRYGAAAAPYSRAVAVGAGAGAQPLHGWQPDTWVQTVHVANVPTLLRGGASVRWRAGAPLDPTLPPFRNTQTGLPVNPDQAYSLAGSYLPVQPHYADMVY